MTEPKFKLPESIHNGSDYEAGLDGRPPITGGSWIDQTIETEPNAKEAIARYAATHFVEYGNGVMAGTGSTINVFMDELLAFQIETGEPLDLKIVTPNLQLLKKFQHARAGNVALFFNTQLHLLGGSHAAAIDSLVGPYCVEGINSSILVPDLVVISASSVTFRNGHLTVGYQFQEELSSKIALAKRSTSHRVFMFDHSKIGRTSGWTIELSVEEILASADRVSFLFTIPNSGARILESIEQEISYFGEMLKDATEVAVYNDKELRLLMLNEDGAVQREISLSEFRKKANRFPKSVNRKRSDL